MQTEDKPEELKQEQKEEESKDSICKQPNFSDLKLSESQITNIIKEIDSEISSYNHIGKAIILIDFFVMSNDNFDLDENDSEEEKEVVKQPPKKIEIP